MKKLFIRSYMNLFGASRLSAWKAWRSMDEGTKLYIISYC